MALARANHPDDGRARSLVVRVATTSLSYATTSKSFWISLTPAGKIGHTNVDRVGASIVPKIAAALVMIVRVERIVPDVLLPLVSLSPKFIVSAMKGTSPVVGIEGCRSVS